MGDKTIDTLIEDIYRILDPENHHESNEENVEFAGEALKEILRTRFSKREEKTGDAILRFSSIGKKDRALWYEAHNTPREKIPPKVALKWLYGDLIELLMIFLTKEAGHNVTHEQAEVTVDGVKGHLDCVVDGVVVDVKSASSFSFQKFKEGAFKFDDPFGYVAQLSGYCHALSESGDVEGGRGAFLVADKVHGDLCLAEIDGYDIRGNPPLPRIQHLRSIIKDETPPPRCYEDVPEGKSGNRKLGVGCSYCAFKDECWKDANGGQGLRKYIYSRGPVWLTNVAREPKVEEVC